MLGRFVWPVAPAPRTSKPRDGLASTQRASLQSEHISGAYIIAHELQLFRRTGHQVEELVAIDKEQRLLVLVQVLCGLSSSLVHFEDARQVADLALELEVAIPNVAKPTYELRAFSEPLRLTQTSPAQGCPS